MFDEDRDDPQQSHADGEIRFLHGCRRRGTAAAALTELDVRREQLDDQRTHALLQQETELLMLHTETRREHKVRERSEGRQIISSCLFAIRRLFSSGCVGFTCRKTSGKSFKTDSSSSRPNVRVISVIPTNQ